MRQPATAIPLGHVAGLDPAAPPPGGTWLALLAAGDNLLVLGLAAFLPLGFTDGSTILPWRQRR